MSATADYIREAREQKGLTLGQVAEATSIPQYYLEILEGGGNDRLVSDRLYMVHFLRAYAAYLEIEVETLAAQFVRENRAVDKSPVPPEAEPRSRKAATVAVLLVLLLIAAGVYVYDPTFENLTRLTRTFTERPAVETPPADAPRSDTLPPSSPVPVATQTPLPSTDRNSVLQPEADETAPAGPEPGGSPPDAASGLATVPAPSTGPRDSVENASATPSNPPETRPADQREVASAPAPAPAAEQAAAEETTAASETAAITEPAAIAEPAGVVEVSPAETAPGEAEPATTAAASESEPPQADSTGAPSTHTLTIVADARSWLRIWVDDKPSRDLMLDAGQSATLSADTGFNITFGNAGGVRLTLNEEELPAVGRSGQVIRNYKLPRPEQATP